MNPALRALNRFGLGARPGEADALGEPRAWLMAQLDEPPPLLDDPSLPTAEDLSEAIRALREAQRARDTEALGRARVRVREIAAAEAGASVTVRLKSKGPFVERLVAFWSNHLCVSAAGKPLVAPLAGGYERDVIRPHVLGRFEDMVLASARHPAMLLYLDNAQSIGPNSAGGRMSARRGRGRGLNENYARELLELHTLGVDGGYTQEDVQEAARVFTGWTVAGLSQGAPRQSGARRSRGAHESRDGFVFQPALHEPGSRTVLGVRYAEAGVGQGQALIRALCFHPATGRFIAAKLVRHFVADDSPPAAVAQVATAFSRSGGDLKEVARAVVGLSEAWDPQHRKIRTPQDWLTAVLRAFDAREAPRGLSAMAGQLRHRLWAPPSPKGFGDTVREWADPDSLMNRAELARTIARRVGRRVDPAGLVELIEVAAGDPLLALVADESIAAPERVALALAGPAFQWR